MSRKHSTNQQLTDAVKEEARRLGFELVGVTSPRPLAHYDTYDDWLAKNYHGEMQYLATDRARIRRFNPKEILPDCKSILVLGMRYAPAGIRNPDTTSSKRGRVAAYAFGHDYHDIIPERQKALVGFLEAQTGKSISNRYYTDTGPVLERELAQRAGLGWFGKNSCLIHPKSGSYFFLAEILLGIELVPDKPLESDHCGSCTRCIDACPTSCILPNRTLDSTRCIAYYTIELKGPIPQELRAPLGEWVFGCDICQEVCPWNIRFANADYDEQYAPTNDAAGPVFVEELKLSPQEFNKKFKGSPIKRAKRRGYLRNITTALGNTQSPGYVAALAHTLQTEFEPLVRAHAAWALGEIGGPKALQALTDALATESEPAVLSEIKSALLNIS